MDVYKTGKTICLLRQKAGFTQRELSEILGVSDKAVSKWERGLACPDISLLPKLANALDSNIESIVCGQTFYYKNSWVGILKIPEKKNVWIGVGTLLYDKPVVYYLLSYFFLLGIKDILVIGKDEDIEVVQKIMCQLPCCNKIMYLNIKDEKAKEKMADFTAQKNVAVFEGMEFIYGLDFTRFCQNAMSSEEKSVILTILGERKTEYNEVNETLKFDYSKKVTEIGKSEEEGDYRIVPFVFCPSMQWNGILKEIDFSDSFIYEICKTQLKKGLLHTEVMGRGMIRMKLESVEDILCASEFVEIIQKKTGQVIGDILEIAKKRGCDL